MLVRGSIVVGLTLLFAPLVPAVAHASFEQVGTFGGEEKEHPPLLGGKSLAVNVTGAGGIPVGTVYGVSTSPEAYGVVDYGPKGEFVRKWGKFRAAGIAVDQSTGDVYIRTDSESKNVVSVYSPDGSQLIASFGEYAGFKEDIAQSPEKVHSIEYSGIAVNDAGTVYLSDNVLSNEPEGRVMVFEPQSPGHYEHYAYSGRSKDIAYATFKDPVEFKPDALALDAAGNLYTSSEGRRSIYEFVPDEPSFPICGYEVPGGGNQSMTTNPQTGEVYYYSYKHRNTISQLSRCNANKEFVLTGALTLPPAPPAAILGRSLYGLAFNPTIAYAPSRSAGALYGIEEFGLGYIFAPAEVHAPAVEAESVTGVDASDASLTGAVDPNGSPTHYAFQYISDAAYQANEPGERFAGAIEAPLGGAGIAAGKAAVSVAVSLSGLLPDTEYHYRLVATSHCNPEIEAEVCEGVGAAQGFRTYPLEPAGLPDGRAYELVSPIVKEGGEAFPLFPRSGSCGIECKPGLFATAFPRQSSPDGEAVVYEGTPFSSGEGAVNGNEYVSRRGGSGWQTTALSPALQSSLDSQYVGVTPSLTTDVLLQGGAVLGGEAPQGYPDLYAQRLSEPGAFSPLLTSAPPDRGENSVKLGFAGGSSDFSRLFFAANDALTGETPSAPAAVDGGAEKMNLYESDAGQLRLVNVLPGNTETTPGAVFGSGEQLRGGGNLSEEDFSHAISDDGSRVFWSDEAGQVYVRENGELTLAIPDAGRFLTASADGSKVLLADGHLYDLQSEDTTDLTGGDGGFQGIAGQSEDLSHVYFVDTAVLTGEEANELGGIAQTGADNLYAWHEGTTNFVATLAAGDSLKGSNGGYPSSAWGDAPQSRTAEASPDGRWVAFRSQARLTGYDNTGPCGFDNPTQKIVSGPCTEVFVYDSATGRLACASCDPTGVQPLGRSYLPLISGSPGSFSQPRYVLDNGRVFFDSADSLSPFDTNDGVEDAYEYEPDAIGSCTREEGCVRLISGGHGSVDSNFLATDETGSNVFFTTRDRLVAVDHDELVDVYDAREGGGIPAQSEVGQHTECHGETCQPPTNAVSDPALASFSFEGPGDLPSPPPGPVVQVKTLTRPQKLARALRECRKKPRRKRAACERTARGRFGAKANGAKQARERRGRSAKGGR